ncbi:MAG: hypothetical protein COB42_07985 [Sulfurimonas sp.]|nr:MAG: hypothetical protein COB42_07985 [Sulfurimonas sp.]
MKKFVFIYEGTNKESDCDISPEIMKKWETWFSSFGDKIVDPGNPFCQGKKVSPDGISNITSEVNATSGYTIINANDIDEASKIAQGCPSGAVNVFEAMPM